MTSFLAILVLQTLKTFLQDPHLQYGLPPMGQGPGMKRSAEGAGLDMMEQPSSDEDSSEQKPQIHSPHHDQYEDHDGWARNLRELSSNWNYPNFPGRTHLVLGEANPMAPPPPTTARRRKDGWGRSFSLACNSLKETLWTFVSFYVKMCSGQMPITHVHKVKIKMEFIDNKLRRYTTFSKRKTGIMKKVSENFLNHGCCGPPQDKDIWFQLILCL